MERLQELGDGDAADAVAGAAGTVPEGAGEEGLPHADGTAEDDVLLLGQPVQAEELADAGAIEADRAVPHDLLEGAVSSKPACSSRRVRPWLSRRSISSWSKSSRNSTGLSFPWRAWVTRSGSVGSRAAQAQPFQSADEIRSSIISKASARAQAALIRSGP